MTDSICNGGYWFANPSLPSSAQMTTHSGRLTITRTAGAEEVSVLGRIAIGEDSADFYRTTGRLDEAGRLCLFTFAPITWNTIPTCKVDGSYTLYSTSYIERSSNTAVRL